MDMCEDLSGVTLRLFNMRERKITQQDPLDPVSDFYTKQYDDLEQNMFLCKERIC